MKRRNLLMQAKKYTGIQDISGWWCSEKLDGTRCFWDGGISRGVPTTEVPYANIFNPKTGELKAKIKPVATGLWSRYSNPIIAPDWFLNQLPSMFLDGELFAGRGRFQKCRSIVAGDVAGPDWDQIEYAIYGCPSIDVVFGDGLVKDPNFNRTIDHKKINEFVDTRNAVGVLEDLIVLRGENFDFDDELCFLSRLVGMEGPAYLHAQNKLSEDIDSARAQVEAMLAGVISQGGEGVVLRDPKAVWAPKRISGLLKYKPFSDAEGRVTGFTSGRKTEKGSKLLGMIGALILDFEGQRLELSGLTNDEREFATSDGTQWASMNPGTDMPEWTQSKHFQRGDSVTFKFRELSDAGIPKEARYWRKR